MNDRIPTPPKFARVILEWYASYASVEDLVGDADEIFYEDLKEFSATKARLKYWRNMISLIFSYAIKKRKRNMAFHAYSTSTLNFSMLKNYFLIGWRSLMKHKLFSVINVFGLAVGMSISLLFISMLSFISRYDDFHVNKDRIFRIISSTDDKQNRYDFASAPEALATYLENYTAVESVVRIQATIGGEIAYREKGIDLTGYFVDSNFLDVFSFPLIQGDLHTALIRPNTAVVTQRTAYKFFGTDEAIGKVVDVPGYGQFEITGILKDLPKNSHMVFDILGSYTSLSNQTSIPVQDAWKEFRNSYVYILAKDRTQESSINTFLSGIAHDVYKNYDNLDATFKLQSLEDIAPGPDLFDQIGPDWGYAGLIVFGILSLLILVPACFNYANISISRAMKRMKEIGLRKTMGGMRGQIFFQFIVETVIIVIFSLGLSYILFDIIRGEFLNMIVLGNESLDLTPNVNTILLFVAFALLVGFVAGIVPALHFSRLTPIQALNSKPRKNNFSKFTLRKSLVVFQFVLSLGFIMTVVIVLNQYRYAMNYDLGFQRENLLDVELQGVDQHLLKNEFENRAFVHSISMSSNIIGTGASGLEWVSKPGKTDSVEVFTASVDEYYLANMNLELIAGDNFKENSSQNGSRLVVNETFVKDFGFETARDAVGKSLTMKDGREKTITGVVKDFNYGTLREPIKSFMFECDPSKYRYANLKVNSKDIYEDIGQLEKSWKTFEPEKRFKAKFLDDEISDAFNVYFSMVKIAGSLGFLAITITCLGLLGMVVFTVENRVKEVGIRKVMGASTAQVAMILSWDFLKIMLIAALIAIPGTYFIIGKMYLAQIQYYRMEVGVFEIAVSLGIMLILGLGTILSQTLRAARANPADTLRHE